MVRQYPIEIITPPNILKAKVGGSVVVLDSAAIKRAETAMQSLKANFEDWVGEDVAHLVSARDGFVSQPDGQSRAALMRASHDIKGQGLTFGFPFVARVAASLCTMLDAVAMRDIPLPLLDAHVDAIRVVMRDQIKGQSDQVATALVTELEARVAELAMPTASG